MPEEINFLGRKNKGFCRRQKSTIFDSAPQALSRSHETCEHVVFAVTKSKILRDSEGLFLKIFNSTN
ncbi:hypothetical protein [Methanobacterium bryantii]|uniref:Uncharacterized protein n=1 Tax=Methanobacterium bryantii TaxID=2161 RepID=A0A2A2HAN4_METBR|nr:hypothetical protein [Methanobacterium bryantii]PAV06314.1 hypothetical protein ASJ80_15935 [Methanobacterium bryantii]